MKMINVLTLVNMFPSNGKPQSGIFIKEEMVNISKILMLNIKY